jgi:hypothetical protein
MEEKEDEGRRSNHQIIDLQQSVMENYNYEEMIVYLTQLQRQISLHLNSKLIPSALLTSPLLPSVMKSDPHFSLFDEQMIVVMDYDRFNDPIRLLACKHRIFHADDLWLEQFCRCGGISVLVENLDNRLENQEFLSEVDAAALYQLLLCL